MKKIRLGIIGTGGISNSHVRAYKQMDDVEIVAGADIIPGKAREALDRWELPEAKAFENTQEMLDTMELDAVSVCTYNSTHAECAIQAMRAGCHVLLEKPMTVTLEDAQAIRRVEKETGKILTVGFQPRYDGRMKKIKEIIQSGKLGKIYYIQTGGGRRRGIPNSTFIEKSTGGIGAMGDIGCYSLDCVLNAIGYPKPLTVTGYTSNYFGTSTEYQSEADAKRFNVDDFAAAFVRLEGGIILDFRIAWAMHLDTPGDSIIMGTKGSLRIPSTDCWNGTVGGPMTIYHDVAGAQTQTTIPVIESKGPGLFDRKIRSFLDAVKNGTPAPVPTSQILYNQAIIDHIVKSAELGHEVEVKIPEI